MEEDIEKLAASLRNKQDVLVFTGAGASAESGIPTFRGNSAAFWAGILGGWVVLPLFGTPFGWNNMPWLAWPGFDRYLRRPIMQAEPNAFHRALYSLTQKQKRIFIITQNVDGLHQRSGILKCNVAEIHGTVWRSVCIKCGKTLWERDPQNTITFEYDESEYAVPYCECGGWPRPDAVLFTEHCVLAESTLAASFTTHLKSDDTTVLIVGMSGGVSTSDGFITSAAGRVGKESVFQINISSTRFDSKCGTNILAPCGEVMARVMEKINL